ncbi:hypothetical protein R3398_19245 [Rossellomorea marisflavi]|uniref:hypothetical protein n=1 Tax=Rossellomorea marisflavi TaxID=189381 RepID=UPI00296F094B|nr:hypothetical protein [Rossellomorea marisflavi]MDW4528482.1 hypothetical protein [Rossellomorea marisflavi]
MTHFHKARHHITKSEEQRRVADSCGKRGKVETLQAAAEAAQAPSPPESGHPQRNETSYPLLTKAIKRIGVNWHLIYMCLIIRDQHLYITKSEEQRRPPDSYGKSGQGETLQACRSGSPHAPWKAGVRSGTEHPLKKQSLHSLKNDHNNHS